MLRTIVSARQSRSRGRSNSQDLFELLERRQLLASAARAAVPTLDEARANLIKAVANKLPPNIAGANPDPVSNAPAVKETGPQPPFSSSGGDTRTVTVGGVVNINFASGNQSEMEIAINKANPLQMYSVWNGSGSVWGAYSTDGGATWTKNNPFAGMTSSCCDNVIDFDQYGNLYLAYLNGSASQLIVGRSINGGQTFTQIHTLTTSSLDNPAINITGNQIIVHTRAQGTAGTIYASSSALGVNTAFSAYQSSPGSSGGAYGDAVVGIDGSWYNAYQSSSGGQGPNFIRIHRDPDGPGPQPYSADLANFSCNVGGFDFIPAQNNRSIDAEVQLAVAPAGSTYAGRVYVVYTDETVNENNDTDIIFRYSDNNGATWSSPVRVNDDNTTRSQFLPKIAVDPTTGAIAVGFYDCRNDNGVLPNGTNGIQNDDVQIFGASSIDGGATWENFMIQPGWSNAAAANNGVDFGDWAGADFYNGKFFYCWSDNSTNTSPANPDRPRLDICTAQVSISAIPVTGLSGIVTNDANANGAADVGEGGINNVTVYLDNDSSGTLTAGDDTTTTNAIGFYSFSGLNPGSYNVRIVTPANFRQTLPANNGGRTVLVVQDQVTTNNNFAATNAVVIGGVAFKDHNGNQTKEGPEPSVNGQTIFFDTNNNGVFDSANLTQPSTDVPKAILDNTTITSNNVISGLGLVTKVTVQLNITHTFDGDLVLTLISPANTRVTLVNRRGSSGDNFTNTIFDDAAATLITAGSPPYNGTFRPEQALSTLNGENANGTWKLEVSDQATQDTGTLNSWSITILSIEPNTTTNGSGQYAFAPQVPNATYRVRQVPLTDHVFTTPSGGLFVANPTGGEVYATNFGNFPVAYTGSDIVLRLSPGGANVQIWVDQSTINPPTYTADKTIISTLSFTGTGGDDSLTVDALNGNPIPTGGVTYGGLSRAPNGDTLIVLGSTGADTIAFGPGSITLSGRTITHNGVEFLRMDGRGGNDVVNVSGGLPVTMFNTQHFATLTIATGNVASAEVGGSSLIVTNSLVLNGTATFDLNDNDMIVFYQGGSVLGSIQSSINSARNGGAWNGTGLTSGSAAAANPKITTLGAMESSDYKSVYGANATFDGESLPGNSVLIKYTYYGDTDFNGVVNFDDYSRIDAGFNAGASGWLNGDFDGNGVINFDDYSLIDLAFNSQGLPL